MSGVSDPENEDRLDLSTMPEDFHPAAAWMRLGLMSTAMLIISFMKPIVFWFYDLSGGVGIVVAVFLILAALATILVCVGTRLERRFSRPKSTKSWGGRTAIGWNLHLSKVEADGIKELLTWRINIHSITLGVLFWIYSRFAYYPDLDQIIPAALVSGALVFVWNDHMRLLADTMAKTDPRVAALMY